MSTTAAARPGRSSHSLQTFGGRLAGKAMRCAVVVALLAGYQIAMNPDPALAAPAEQIVSLGDSFSSGEGNPPFDVGTDSGKKRCHRSPEAWPRILGATATHHLACSGAVWLDLFEGQVPSSQNTVDSVGQISRLRTIAQQETVSAVTVQIGGNNVGFDKTLQSCYLAACITDIAKDMSRINRVSKQLGDIVYPAIRAAVSPEVPIVVVGYPRLFPLNRSETTGCRDWLSAREQRDINALQEHFERSLKAAVKASGLTNITFVSVLSASQGHEMCRDHSWFFRVSAVDCKINQNRTTNSRCAHPRPPLHRAIARRVRDALAPTAPPLVLPSSDRLVATGGSHACAVVASGRVTCWGYNKQGQLGNGTEVSSALPANVVELSAVKDLAAGNDHTCAVLISGAVKCWGFGIHGALGDGTETSSSRPVAVLGISTAVQVAAGDQATCALIADRSVMCWGHNSTGRFGPFAKADSAVPIAVPGISDAAQVAVGYDHACAVLEGGTVKCWGRNFYGQLGDGTRDDRGVPVTVAGITNAVHVALGFGHSCAALATGAIACWGRNNVGQVGDGSTSNSLRPTVVSGVAGAVEVAAGQYHTCVLLFDGTVRCWGGRIALGNDAAANSARPVQVVNLSGVAQLAAGGDHTCASTSSGRLVCWGRGTYGANGDGTYGDALSPVNVLASE